MQNLPAILTYPTMGWLPPVIFSVLMVIGLLVGFIQGWKIALYFFCWNIVGLILGIFIFDVIWGTISSKLTDLLSKSSDLNMGSVLSIAKGPLKLIFALLVMMAMTSISLIPYAFLRKRLKKTMKANKAAKQSNKKSRIFGSSIALITVAPYAIFVSSVSTVVSPINEFSNISNKMTNIFSFVQTKDVASNYDDIIAIVELTKPEKIASLKKAISNIIKPGTYAADIQKSIKENKSQIQALINHAEEFRKLLTSNPKFNEITDELKKLKNDSAKKESFLNRIKKNGIIISSKQLETLLAGI